MSRFDFDKLFAEAKVNLTQEQQDNLHQLMDKVIVDVEQEAQRTSSRVVSAEIEKLHAARDQQRQETAQLRADIASIEKLGQRIEKAVADRQRATLDAIKDEGTLVTSEITKLTATRVAAELAWNDLPKKIVIGVAAFVGLAVGALLTVLVAASERRHINTQIEVTQQQVQQLQGHLEHWKETAGFELLLHRGKPMIRLEQGLSLARYVPTLGALSAGNLWRVEGQ